MFCWFPRLKSDVMWKQIVFFEIDVDDYGMGTKGVTVFIRYMYMYRLNGSYNVFFSLNLDTYNVCYNS